MKEATSSELWTRLLKYPVRYDSLIFIYEYIARDLICRSETKQKLQFTTGSSRWRNPKHFKDTFCDKTRNLYYGFNIMFIQHQPKDRKLNNMSSTLAISSYICKFISIDGGIFNNSEEITLTIELVYFVKQLYIQVHSLSFDKFVVFATELYRLDKF